ncbi:MAG: endonuclease/exonuclease/phosphatase family protein [Thermoguttaceae bacterium]|nr:endonuclease/exonuclease/phosphatase family protein [Thermoguttaceae bacterium]
MQHFPRLNSFCGIALASVAFLVPAASTFADDAKSPENAAKPTVLRVLSYNIQIGRAPGGSYSDPAQAFLDRTAKVIADVNPDVAGLQEVDNQTNRSGADVDQLATLAEKTGLNGKFESKIELPGGLYGVGVLSREKPLQTAKVYLQGSAHRRVLQICEFENYVFFNTHFPLTQETRLQAVKIIEEEAKKYDKPIILVGDINATPDSAEVVELKKTWRSIGADAPTFRADKPTVQIDYVFIRNAPNASVVETCVVDEPLASDHRPVFCVVEF